MANTFVFTNNAQTTLATAVGSTTTTFALASGTGGQFPSPTTGQQFAIRMIDAATHLEIEIVYCTARSGDTLTVLRGQEGTTAQSWGIGDIVSHEVTAGTLTAIESNSTLSFGTRGEVVLSSSTTLTASNAGQSVVMNGTAPTTVTVPLANATAQNQCPLVVVNQSTAILTLAIQGGNEFGNLTGNPVLQLQPGQSAGLLNDGSITWFLAWNDAGTTQPFTVGAAVLSTQAAQLGQVVQPTAAFAGNGAEYVDVTASRAIGTTYTNSNGRPIFVSVRGNSSSSNWTATVNGVVVVQIAGQASSGGGITFMVPLGATYEVSGPSSLEKWYEL